MIKIIAINGSPRKKRNTATMLDNFLDGATSAADGVVTKRYNLFDYKYQGCISCFACKKPGKKYGRCTVKDDISGLLEKVAGADGVVFGSPVYFGDITAQLRGFLERLLYQYLTFDSEERKMKVSLAPKKVHNAMIYTMNITREVMDNTNYRVIFGQTEEYLSRILGFPPQLVYAFNTYQYRDYSKYKASCWSESEKAEYRRTYFPGECRAAFEAGRVMVENIIKDFD